MCVPEREDSRRVRMQGVEVEKVDYIQQEGQREGYKMVMRPALLYGLETVVVTKRQGAELEL